MRTFLMFGTFRGKLEDNFDDQRNGVFGGTIRVDDSGKFTGELTDFYGKSTIEGFVDNLQISFSKQYCGKEGVIKYFLMRRDYMTGWAGTWEYEPKSSEGGHTGQAFCSLFSLD